MAPTHARYRVLAWLCSLSMITYIDRVCIMQVQGDMQHDLGLSKQQFSWVFSAFALAYAAFEVPSGWLGDRLGPRKVLTRIILCWLMFTALTGCVPRWDAGIYVPWTSISLSGSLLLLLLVRFLFGAGEAGAYPNIAKASRNWIPFHERGRSQGLIWTFGRWGGALAPVLIIALSMPVAWLGYDGWRGAFLLLGLIGLVWLIGFATYFRNTPQEHPGANQAERDLISGAAPTVEQPTLNSESPDIGPASFADDPAAMESAARFSPEQIGNPYAPGRFPAGVSRLDESAQATKGTASSAAATLSWSTVLTSPTLWCLSFMYFCSNSGWSFFITYAKPYLEKDLHLEGWTLHFASGAPLFFGGLGCLLGGFLTDRLVPILGPRWGRTSQGMVAYGLGGAFFLLAVSLTGTHNLAAFACICVASFVKDFAMAASWATTLDIGHRYSGTVAGLMNTVGNLGTVVSPPIVAGLVVAVGLGESVGLYYYGAMFLVASLCWLFINPRRVIVYA